ncbi:MAG: NAD(P)-dependent oxidoreductase [Caldilineaceae bacterium]|nr:NAD(P)-dependent oxidoreductase [Caldilineaceae bacterium]
MRADQATHYHRVLVTGAAGAIGRLIAGHLEKRGHRVRGFDRLPVPELADQIIGNLGDRAAVCRAVAGMDTVIHLAAFRNDADFMQVLLEPNVIGLYEVCEAAQLAGVQRLVLASTIQVINGFGPDEEPVRVSDGPRPTNHYALTKLWAEITGEMYARVHKLSVINVRVGWFPRDAALAQRIQASPRGKDTYLSHDDACHFFTRCVESPTPKPGECVTLFAASRAQTKPRFDLTDGEAAIGYRPQSRWPEGVPFDIGA